MWRYQTAAHCAFRRARGGMSNSGGLETLRLCSDQLYAESEITGRTMNLGLHPHAIGQPHHIAALRDFVAYAASHESVWFATREAIASWYLQVHESHISDAGSKTSV
jgi:allantoinase